MGYCKRATSRIITVVFFVRLEETLAALLKAARGIHRMDVEGGWGHSPGCGVNARASRPFPLTMAFRRLGRPHQLGQLGDVGRDPTRLVLSEPLHKIAADRLVFIEHVGEDLPASIDDAQHLAIASVVNAPGWRETAGSRAHPSMDPPGHQPFALPRLLDAVERRVAGGALRRYGGSSRYLIRSQLTLPRQPESIPFLLFPMGRLVPGAEQAQLFALILAADEGWRGHQIEYQHPSFHHAHATALNSCRCTPARTKHTIPDSSRSFASAV